MLDLNGLVDVPKMKKISQESQTGLHQSIEPCELNAWINY